MFKKKQQQKQEDKRKRTTAATTTTMNEMDNTKKLGKTNERINQIKWINWIK